jgi:hypothetical protein
MHPEFRIRWIYGRNWLYMTISQALDYVAQLRHCETRCVSSPREDSRKIFRVVRDDVERWLNDSATTEKVVDCKWREMMDSA